MRKLLLLFLGVVSSVAATAQCTPNPMYADSLFGVWPDTTTNFAAAGLNISYAQQLDLIVPTSSGVIIPGTTYQLDSVQFTGITNLPPGLEVVCASQTSNSCTYLTGQLGCGVIQGIPTQLGTFELVLNVIGFAAGPGGSAIPVPYQFNGYRITVMEPTSIAEIPSQGLAGVKNVPNPFTTRTAFEFNVSRATTVVIRVFNLLGGEMWKQTVQAKAGQNKIPFEGGNLPEGVYLYKVESGKESYTGRMVLSR